MVEAALVIPVLIVTILATISLMSALYEKTTLRYQLHREEMRVEETKEEMGDLLRISDFMKGLM